MRTIGKQEVDRYYDLDAGDLVIVSESTHVAQWNMPDDKSFTRRTEKRVKLTRGELDYLRQHHGATRP